MKCKECNGTGTVTRDGQVPNRYGGGMDDVELIVTCDDCDGSGKAEFGCYCGARLAEDCACADARAEEAMQRTIDEAEADNA